MINCLFASNASLCTCSHSIVEVLGGFSQIGRVHQVLTVLELATLLQQAFVRGLCRGDHVRVGILIDVAHSLGHVIPVDLELGDSGLLSKNVPGESLNDGGGRWVLIQLHIVVLNVDVVADAEELLTVLVRACEENSGHSNDVAHWQVAWVWGVSLSSHHTDTSLVSHS